MTAIIIIIVAVVVIIIAVVHRQTAIVVLHIVSNKASISNMGSGRWWRARRACAGCGQGGGHTRGTGAWWVDECDDGGSCRVEGHVHGVNLAQECEDICARTWAWMITQKWPVVGFITSSPQPHTRSHQRVYQLVAAYAGRLLAPMALSTIAAYSARHQLDA